MRSGRITVDGETYVHHALFQAVSDQNLEMGLEQNRQRALMNNISRELKTVTEERDRAVRDAEKDKATLREMIARTKTLQSRLQETM